MTKIDGADLDHFIFHLHDETRWPAKYYKSVIQYAIAHAKKPDLEPPMDISYPRCVREYAQKSWEEIRVSGETAK